MLLLADENQHPLVVARLREAEHHVEWIAETMPGAADATILGRTDIGTLTFLTYDRDFGDLIFHRGYPAPRTILYIRLNRARPLEIADRIATMIETGLAAGHIITINERGERTRPFPAGASHG